MVLFVRWDRHLAGYLLFPLTGKEEFTAECAEYSEKEKGLKQGGRATLRRIRIRYGSYRKKENRIDFSANSAISAVNF
jgi:hypothetical protein